MSRQERAGVSLPATYVLGLSRGEGYVENLSADGLCLRSPMIPKEGELPSVRASGRISIKSSKFFRHSPDK